ncbi:MAG: alanine--tRNA ligase [Candidatus Omnitrophica bacterium]|nr:alanine--tRNA ligase [Candidatus Omnitrophota bacterium]
MNRIMMTTNEIRKLYLDFFKSKGHTVLASDSLVPHNDPTLLFTGAGMNQFKEYFLGLKKDLKRASTSQKCLRTGDLDEVGRTAFHHSFFEMLGNFSFGNYFKEEAIVWAWELLTEKLKIAPERLRISVHQSDEEAYKIWKDKIGLRADRIYKKGDKSNFWPSNAPKDGPNGPCGPCSEIYYDQNAAHPDGGDIEDTDGRFAEIWNLVFTQYDRQDGGILVPLAQKNIDTGMGLERLACVLQAKTTNFEIDLFSGILADLAKVLGVAKDVQNARTFYMVADHLRAVVMSMADGVTPSNEGRGYVIRKLVRRAVWQSARLAGGSRGKNPLLYGLVPSVIDAMKPAYPEICEAQDSIKAAFRNEEERFLETLDTGLKILENHLSQARASKSKQLPGSVVFELYDTYGFPEELTRMIAEESGLGTDRSEFESLMASQREKAKKASAISGSIFTSSELEKKVLALPATRFFGYETLEADAKVLFTSLQGQDGIVVLDQSPFYAESGGQTGDRGVLSSPGFKAEVLDTQKKDKVFLHSVRILEGSVKEGAAVRASVNAEERLAAMRNHTATHLLHAALRQVLGPEVRQLGSLVSAEKLRFDYSYGKPLSEAQLRAIEASVNREVLKSQPVSKEEKGIDAAKSEGAIAFFGEKYGDKVRVVTVPGYSKELCGGTHCDNTGQIGTILITSDTSIASGTRRIEALTGESALASMRQTLNLVANLCQELKVTPDQLTERVEKLRKTIKQLEKDVVKGGVSAVDTKQILSGAKSAGSVQFVSYLGKSVPMAQLLPVSDALKSDGKKTVYLLATQNDDKVQMILGLSRDLAGTKLDLRELMRELSPLTGVQGGGRGDLVQGGGDNRGQFQKDWNLIEEKAMTYLAAKGA